MSKARKRGESTTALCERKRVLASLFFSAVKNALLSWTAFSASHVNGVITRVQKFRLVLTKKIYLSNIRHVSWGVQWNGRDLTMYRLHALQIRRAKDATTGHSLAVCSNE
jgi:hypothetical protein